MLLGVGLALSLLSCRRGEVLEALMAQKASGTIPGIHGRLVYNESKQRYFSLPVCCSLIPSQGDLGAIAEQYDVAISTACAALEHIVVESMDTAVQCVQFLKRSGVGVATFIALDKVGVKSYCLGHR